MLTDDDLTRDLRAAFSDATDDLTYDALAPTVRRTPAWASRGWLALPAVAATAAVAVVATGPQAGVGTVADPPSGTPTAPTTSAAPPATEPPLELVTERFEVAGFTIAYRRPADQGPMTLHVFRREALPDDARPIDLPGEPRRSAWIGTDDSSGDGALYLRDGGRAGEKWLAVASPGVSAAELRDLLADEAGD
ncbi:MAG TPA: hypothetical protein VMF51_16135 [Nocardioides sp.]|uniref:hypothetical protein n=1 Tax=Nocardioides sp. TaxID=35761 RepID=UPI002BA03853|nr:hypothetical protein [Nocardioides sp.]HTW16665.1 hypothetical protein [Nocardioides sp.]